MGTVEGPGWFSSVRKLLAKDAKFGVTPPDIRSQNYHSPRFITLCHQQSFQSNLFLTFSKFISFYIFSFRPNFLPFAAAFQEALQMRICCWEEEESQVDHLRENMSLKYASIQLIWQEKAKRIRRKTVMERIKYVKQKLYKLKRWDF